MTNFMTFLDSLNVKQHELVWVDIKYVRFVNILTRLTSLLQVEQNFDIHLSNLTGQDPNYNPPYVEVYTTRTVI